MAATATLTYIGGPTVILEVAGLRLLTDPTFDPPGRHYSFGFGTGSTKQQGPAITLEDIGAIDAVLLSHDQHDDNLDELGRDALQRAPRVVTTKSAARRLGGQTSGLAPWQTTAVDGRQGRVQVTAVPARHGIPGSRPLVGESTGFILEWEGQPSGPLYLSGDTVYFRGIEEIGRRYRVGVAILNLGAVRFPISGPARYTFTPGGAARAAATVGAKRVVPIHVEGWSHFHTPRPAVEAAFTKAGVGDLLRWPEAGRAISLDD